METRKNYYIIILLIVFSLLYSACSTTEQITENPYDKNFVVQKDENTDEILASSEPVKIIDDYISNFYPRILNSGDENIHLRDLTMYFQENQNKYWLAFRYYSYGGYSRALENVNIKFNDASQIKLENPIVNNAKNDGPYNSYSITFFEISESDLINLSLKDIKEIRSVVRYEHWYPILENQLDVTKSSTIKYLAKSFAKSVTKLKN